MEAIVNLLELIGKGPDAVRGFVAATPLAATDENGHRIAAILPAHPIYRTPRRSRTAPWPIR